MRDKNERVGGDKVATRLSSWRFDGEPEALVIEKYL